MSEENKFPNLDNLKQSIENFLFEEEGNITRNKVLMIGSVIILLGIIWAEEAFAAHRSHSSHSSHRSHSSGSGGHSSHSSHVSHSSGAGYHSSHSSHSSGYHSSHSSGYHSSYAPHSSGTGYGTMTNPRVVKPQTPFITKPASVPVPQTSQVNALPAKVPTFDLTVPSVPATPQIES
jgi:cytoskeletal protein RodZ